MIVYVIFANFFVHHCHGYSVIVVDCVLLHRRIGPLPRYLFCQSYTRCQCFIIVASLVAEHRDR
jgi:hypothetical protein